MNLSWAYASNPVKEGNVITGHVIEKGSEAGIAYATVLIVETGKGTVTNDEGYFRFKDIPAGEYTLKVQMMGYTTQTKKVTVSKEFTVDMHFVMEEDVIQVDEVVVSANRNETSRKLAPVVVNVMNILLTWPNRSITSPVCAWKTIVRTVVSRKSASMVWKALIRRSLSTAVR